MELFTSILALLSGLAIFMYSMKMTSGGLEAVAGNKLKGVLQKLTDNRLKGVGVGAGVTALIQSSTAVTVMVIGFVNAGLLRYRRIRAYPRGSRCIRSNLLEK